MSYDPYQGMPGMPDPFGGMAPSEYDPRYLAEMVGQKYNPYQGYPTKQVSDQVWDVYGPTPDYLIAQLAGMANPQEDEFSLDAFFQADPLIRGPLSEAYSAAEGDTMGAYNELQSPEMQDRMRQQIGRTEWDALQNRGDLRSIAAVTGEEKDDAALNYYQRALEGAMAGGAPTSQRNLQMYDEVAQRFGGRPYPGAGQDVTNFQGPGFTPDMGSVPQGEPNRMTDAWSNAGAQPDKPQSLARQALEATPDMDADPMGTDPLAGMMSVGADEGPDRMVYDQGRRFAVVDGKRYELADTAAGPGGTNPYYTNQLRAVMAQRAQRIREESGWGEDVDRPDDEDRRPDRPSAGSYRAVQQGVKPGYYTPNNEDQGAPAWIRRNVFDSNSGLNRGIRRASERVRGWANPFD